MSSNILPLLENIRLDQNNDPNFFNSVFNSKFSKRILTFESSSNYLTSIDPNINPKNTRRLMDLTIQSNTLRDTDFEALSHFEFKSIRRTAFILEKIEKCESLKTIQ